MVCMRPFKPRLSYALAVWSLRAQLCAHSPQSCMHGLAALSICLHQGAAQHGLTQHHQQKPDDKHAKKQAACQPSTGFWFPKKHSSRPLGSYKAGNPNSAPYARSGTKDSQVTSTPTTGSQPAHQQVPQTSHATHNCTPSPAAPALPDQHPCHSHPAAHGQPCLVHAWLLLPRRCAAASLLHASQPALRACRAASPALPGGTAAPCCLRSLQPAAWCLGCS